MAYQTNRVSGASIVLVDGDAATRHARQLLLRAEGAEVRAYPACDAALADPAALQSACVIADADMAEIDGVDLLHRMRSKGWRGRGLLLADPILPALLALGLADGFAVARPITLDDRGLLAVVDAALGYAAP